MKALIFSILLLARAYAAEDISKMTNAEKVDWSFNTMNRTNVGEVVDTFYHEDIEFSDPVEKIRGRQGIKDYYNNMYKNVKEIKFAFGEFVSQGDTVVGVWVMTLKTDSLNDGEPFSVDGTSVIRFKDGKAIYHRDYFDMGAFIYEKIPVVGWMVRKVKSKLKLESEHK